MYNFTQIRNTNHIGDSLKTVNSNYNNLDLWTQNILLSASDLWQPLIDLYKNHQDDWKESLTIAQQNSSRWISVATTVETNSALWIKPLTVFYPDIISLTTPVSGIKDTITSWINQNFPVLPEYIEVPNYVELHEAYIHYYYHHTPISIKETHNIIDQTTCQTQDGTAYATCRTYFTGIARCSNGDMQCDGQAVSCPLTQSVECYYNVPPLGPYIVGGTGFKTQSIPQDPITYIDDDGNEVVQEVAPVVITTYGTDNTTGIGYITANIDVEYNNRQELKSIGTFKFVVKDCKWTFDTDLYENQFKL